jgi:hypothetical protein
MFENKAIDLYFDPRLKAIIIDFANFSFISLIALSDLQPSLTFVREGYHLYFNQRSYYYTLCNLNFTAVS